jgi:hypothetical protein
MECTIQKGVEEGVWHIVLLSLQVKGTSKGHKCSEEAGGKSCCVCISILLLEISSHDKASFVLTKIPVLIELVAEYPHQGYSVFDVLSRDIWLSKGALLPAFIEFSLSSSFKLLPVGVALEFFPVTWWRR